MLRTQHNRGITHTPTYHSNVVNPKEVQPNFNQLNTPACPKEYLYGALGIIVETVENPLLFV